ncbi:hypothetical protein GGU11DRAFT_804256, partial [Lentinula aff. detonsa]
RLFSSSTRHHLHRLPVLPSLCLSLFSTTFHRVHRLSIPLSRLNLFFSPLLLAPLFFVFLLHLLSHFLCSLLSAYLSTFSLLSMVITLVF